MSPWKTTKLARVGQWLSGGTPSKKVPSLWDGPVPWVSPKDMKRPRMADAIDHVAHSAIGNGTQLAPRGSLLMVVRGMILAHGFPVAVTTAPVAFNQDIKALVPSSDFDSEFLLHWLQYSAPLVLRLVDVANHGTKRLPSERLFDLDVPTPPLTEQKRIAAALHSMDDVADTTQAAKEQLHVTRQALLTELLTRGLPGRHAHFQQSEYGQAPASWSLLELRDLCTVDGLQTGPFGSQLKAREYTPTGVPVIMPKDIVGNRISTATIARIPAQRAAELSQHRLRPGDIVIGRRGDMGRCALITEDESGWICGTGCLRARLTKNADAAFVVKVIGSAAAIKWLNDHAVGQTMLNLNTDILGDLPIYVPAIDEQRAIARLLDAVDESARVADQELAELWSLKRALSSALFTGQRRVPLAR